MARLLEVLKAFPVAPRLLIALATGVDGRRIDQRDSSNLVRERDFRSSDVREL